MTNPGVIAGETDVPRIASAQVKENSLLITGTGFGNKPKAAPFFFQPFRATQEGQSPTEAGFDVTGGNNCGAKRNHVTMGDGVGGGSLLHEAPCGTDPTLGGESFHHVGKLLPSGTDEAFASCWVKLTRLRRTPGSFIQLKGIRMSPTEGNTDGQAMYRTLPKYAFSVFLNPQLRATTNHPYWWASGDRVEHRDSEDFHPQDYDNVWVSWEAYYRLNTIGQANGIQDICLGGYPISIATNLQVKKMPGEHLGYVQFSPGITNGTEGADWEFRLARCYIDTSRARVFLGNAATLAACTGRFVLPARNWQNDRVEVQLGQPPQTYDWIYLCTGEGMINGNGYRYSLPHAAP